MPKDDNQKKIDNSVKVTKEGLEELKAELAELRDVKLPTVVKRVTTARAHGDLSENAEYHDAKEEQNLVETRISEIEDIVDRAQIVKQTKSQSKVGIGSTVTTHREDKPKKTNMFYIVGEYEADPTEGKISAVSPLGKALIGKKVGETAKVEAPAGTILYKIDKIG